MIRLYFYDMMTIPADAAHPKNAERFMNYLLRPEIMASISSYVRYFNAVPASKPLASREVRNNPNIFLPDELPAKMFLMTPLPPEFSEKVGKSGRRSSQRRAPPNNPGAAPPPGLFRLFPWVRAALRALRG